MKILATLVLSTLVLSGSLRADPIWSYQFTEQQPDASFVIWHEGPLVPIGDRVFVNGADLHSCWPATTLFYCAFVQLIIVNTDDLLVVFSRQPLDPRMDPIMTDQILLTGAKLGVPGTYSMSLQGIGTLKISNDPADLAPEPSTWALLSLAAVGVGLTSVRRKSKRRLFDRT